MEALQKYLAELHETCKQASQTQTSILPLIGDIKSICFHEIEPSNLSLCTDILVTSEIGILSFLQKTCNRKDIPKREEVAHFFHEYVQYMRYRQFPYAEYVVCSLMSLFRREQASNTVRNAFLSPVNSILQHYHDTINPALLGVTPPPTPVFSNSTLSASGAANTASSGQGVREMVDTLMREFITVRGSVQSLKSTILCILGSLAEYFPDDVEYKIQALSPLFLDTLQGQFKAKKQDQRLIAGALEGLCSLLMCFPSVVTSPAAVKNKVLQHLYMYIRASVNLPEKLARYDVPRAALKMLGKHSYILREYCVEDCKHLYDCITTLCLHTNKVLRGLAYDALDAFLVEVAAELTRQRRDPSADRETFSYFIMKFWSMLSQSSRVSDIAIATRVC